jgi:hypothetical protein
MTLEKLIYAVVDEKHLDSDDIIDFDINLISLDLGYPLDMDIEFIAVSRADLEHQIYNLL